MAVTHLWYGNAFVTTFNKESDWDTDTVKCMLTTSTYAVSQDNHNYKDDVTNEVSSSGYSAGGATISPLTASYTGGTNVYALDGSDAAWTGVTFTTRYAVVYNSTPGSDATRPLLSYVDFGADQSPAGVNFTIAWDAAGIVKVTVS